MYAIIIFYPILNLINSYIYKTREQLHKLFFLTGMFWNHPLSRRSIMFGFQGGESTDTIARKKAYMKDAQQKWPFLTNFDCSTIKTEGQLGSMVKTRSGITDEQAKLDVGAWMQGKRF